MNLPLEVEVDLQPNVGGFAFDCRLLFVGDRIRQLVRTYEEIIHRFKRFKDPKRLFDNLQTSEEIKQFYEIHQSNGVTSVELRPSIFQDAAPERDLNLDVQFRLGKKSFVVPLLLEQIKPLGKLLPLLRSDLNEEDIQVKIAAGLNKEQMEWTQYLLSLLSENGFLTTEKLPRNFFLQSPPRPRVTFLGHSSLLFQSTRASVVADPLLRLKLRLPPFGMDVPRLKLNAIIISHTHWDHCDLQTLLWFDKDTQILVPKVIQPTVFNPPVVEAMRLLGFNNIKEVNLWEPVQIEDIEVIPVPFHGEQDEPDAVIDHFTYVLKTEGLKVYGGVDSYRDTFGDMKPVLQKIKDEHAPHLAFLPVSRMVYRYEWGGVNGFCRYLDTSLMDKEFQYTASGSDAAEWVQVLQPKWTAPYATFNFKKWSAPAQVAEFEGALTHLGLRESLYPFRPFDVAESSDFLPGHSKEVRRRAIVKWFKFGSTASKYHQKFLKNRLYRYLSYRIAERVVTEHH